jgi:hypothetical protein
MWRGFGPMRPDGVTLEERLRRVRRRGFASVIPSLAACWTVVLAFGSPPSWMLIAMAAGPQRHRTGRNEQPH